MRRVALALAVFSAPALAAERTAYAVIVANNLSVDPGVAPLRYADDDAARYFEMFSPWVREARLLAVLDDETQRLHRQLAMHAQPPTRTELVRAVSEIADRMKADRAAGSEPTLYFVYVGHGNVGANGEGYVSLLDGRFTRGDLFRTVIAASPAAFIHVIIDACQSYFMINARGELPAGESYAAAVKAYLGESDLARYPNVGVVVSTARESESHEWSGFGAGVFSHELRSALLGAADVNGDGRVEYSELKAFVAAANLHVDDPRARLDVFARAPALDRSRPLIDLTNRGFPRFVFLPASLSGRFWIEDVRGVRLADFNKAPGGSMVVALPLPVVYFLRSAGSEARIEPSGPRLIDASGLAWGRQALAARGALQTSFQRFLFDSPYGDAFYRAYAASTGDLPVAPAVQPLPDP
jgi:hypothetical protein